jgi:glutamate 5-kinase
VTKFLVLLAAATLTSVSFGQADQSTDFARGGMHFRAKAMDTDNDGMISKDEFMKYHADMWSKMTKDSNGSMSVADASSAFARGGMHVDVKAMDSNGTGMITQEMFMKYEATHWSLLPRDANDQISVVDLEKAMKMHRKRATAAAGTTDTAKPN